MGGACADDKEITIIVQDLGQFSGVKSAVHHFGHMFGAFHDGEDSSSECCSDQGNVMTNYVYNEENINKTFHKVRKSNVWSTCSLEVINALLKIDDCLRNAPIRDDFPLYSWQELTHRHKGAPWLQEQCNNVNNTHGGRCGNDPCGYLQCFIPGTQTCLVHEELGYAMEGSICEYFAGWDKPLEGRCFQGNCIQGNAIVRELAVSSRVPKCHLWLLYLPH